MPHVIQTGCLIGAVLLITAGGGCARPSFDPCGPVEYVSDASLFKDGHVNSLNGPERQAIAATQVYLERIYGHAVRGRFSIAATTDGYQVNFRNLERHTDQGDSETLLEGFGAAWVRDGQVIRADMGP